MLPHPQADGEATQHRSLLPAIPAPRPDRPERAQVREPALASDALDSPEALRRRAYHRCATRATFDHQTIGRSRGGAGKTPAPPFATLGLSDLTRSEWNAQSEHNVSFGSYIAER